MVFPAVMYGCESWTIKKAEHQRIDAFKLWCWRRLLRVLDCKEIQPVHPKGNQSWIFIGRTDAEAETPKLWPTDVKNWLIGKDPDAGQDWRQEKGMTEDDMAEWHHWLNGHEFEQALSWWWKGSLECCSPWGHKELDTTEQLIWTDWSIAFAMTLTDFPGGFYIFIWVLLKCDSTLAFPLHHGRCLRPLSTMHFTWQTWEAFWPALSKHPTTMLTSSNK